MKVSDNLSLKKPNKNKTYLFRTLEKNIYFHALLHHRIKRMERRIRPNWGYGEVVLHLNPPLPAPPAVCPRPPAARVDPAARTHGPQMPLPCQMEIVRLSTVHVKSCVHNLCDTVAKVQVRKLEGCW